MQHHFREVGDITITNTLFAMEKSTAYTVAMKLLFTSFQVMPVLDSSGKVVGKVTELDLLKLLKAGRDLRDVRVEYIMRPTPPVVTTEMQLEQAIQIIDTNQLTQLPVTKNGRFIGSVTRHDLLRACLGIWLDHERGSYTEVIA
jgi:predicted transcriptional regulator